MNNKEHRTAIFEGKKKQIGEVNLTIPDLLRGGTTWNAARRGGSQAVYGCLTELGRKRSALDVTEETGTYGQRTRKEGG